MGTHPNCISVKAWSSRSNWNSAFSSLNPTADILTVIAPFQSFILTWTPLETFHMGLVIPRKLLPSRALGLNSQFSKDHKKSHIL